MLALVVSPLVVAAPAAWAQSNPSANEIIKSLTPKGNLTGTQRGIKSVKPATTDAEPATSVASVSLSVRFATDSAELTPQAMAILDELGRALTSQELAQYRFRIEGHTDTVGSPGYNKTLSQRRADTVAAYLAQKYAVPSARLEPVGLGEEGLAVATPPQTDNAQNRRVKVVNLGG
jgi:outer membrane protein OmpA-like peptidoglycan-associated protein